MRRLICTFVVRIWHKTRFRMTWPIYWNQNLIETHHDKTNKVACAPSEDSDQPGHPHGLTRAFAVRMKKAWVLSYPLIALIMFVRLLIMFVPYHCSSMIDHQQLPKKEHYAGQKMKIICRGKMFAQHTCLFLKTVNIFWQRLLLVRHFDTNSFSREHKH